MDGAIALFLLRLGMRWALLGLTSKSTGASNASGCNAMLSLKATKTGRDVGCLLKFDQKYI